MYISSRDNVNIKRVCKLLSQSKYRREMKTFVIEGMRGCVDAAHESTLGNLEITAFYYTSQALEKYSQSLPVSWLDSLDERKKYEISPELADKISDTGASQGVFVEAKMVDIPFEIDSLISNGKYIVLTHLQDPGNIGTILRTADAVGASGIVLTKNCCDLYNPKLVRSAVGSMSRVRIFIENDFGKVADTFKLLGIENVASVIIGGVDVKKFDFTKPCAVYIGNEGNGLSDHEVALLDSKITIEMHGNVNSLNAAIASTIIAWEMFRDER